MTLVRKSDRLSYIQRSGCIYCTPKQLCFVESYAGEEALQIASQRLLHIDLFHSNSLEAVVMMYHRSHQNHTVLHHLSTHQDDSPKRFIYYLDILGLVNLLLLRFKILPLIHIYFLITGTRTFIMLPYLNFRFRPHPKVLHADHPRISVSPQLSNPLRVLEYLSSHNCASSRAPNTLCGDRHTPRSKSDLEFLFRHKV